MHQWAHQSHDQKRLAASRGEGRFYLLISRRDRHASSPINRFSHHNEQDKQRHLDATASTNQSESRPASKRSWLICNQITEIRAKTSNFKANLSPNFNFKPQNTKHRFPCKPERVQQSLRQGEIWAVKIEFFNGKWILIKPPILSLQIFTGKQEISSICFILRPRQIPTNQQCSPRHQLSPVLVEKGQLVNPSALRNNQIL